MKTDTSAVNIDRDIGDFQYKVDYGYDAGVGLDERVVNYISDVKQDPDWVREFRLKALQTFESKPLPTHWASKDLKRSISIRFVIIWRKVSARRVRGMKFPKM